MDHRRHRMRRDSHILPPLAGLAPWLPGHMRPPGRNRNWPAALDEAALDRRIDGQIRNDPYDLTFRERQILSFLRQAYDAERDHMPILLMGRIPAHAEEHAQASERYWRGQTCGASANGHRITWGVIYQDSLTGWLSGKSQSTPQSLPQASAKDAPSNPAPPVVAVDDKRIAKAKFLLALISKTESKWKAMSCTKSRTYAVTLVLGQYVDYMAADEQKLAKDTDTILRACQNVQNIQFGAVDRLDDDPKQFSSFTTAMIMIQKDIPQSDMDGYLAAFRVFGFFNGDEEKGISLSECCDRHMRKLRAIADGLPDSAVEEAFRVTPVDSIRIAIRFGEKTPRPKSLALLEHDEKLIKMAEIWRRASKNIQENLPAYESFFSQVKIYNDQGQPEDARKLMEANSGVVGAYEKVSSVLQGMEKDLDGRIAKSARRLTPTRTGTFSAVLKRGSKAILAGLCPPDAKQEETTALIYVLKAGDDDFDFTPVAADFVEPYRLVAKDLLAGAVQARKEPEGDHADVAETPWRPVKCDRCGGTGIYERREMRGGTYRTHDIAVMAASEANERDAEADPDYVNAMRHGGAYMSKKPAWAAVPLENGLWGVGRLDSVRTICDCANGDALRRQQAKEEEDARKDAITRLAMDLKGTTDKSHNAAVKLAQIGPNEARVAIPALIEAARSSHDQYLREKAVIALRCLCRPADKDAIAELLERLKDEYQPVRFEAVVAFGCILEGQKPPEGMLIALKDKSQHVRSEALAALLKMSPDKASLSALMESLKDENVTARSRAARAIGRLGETARDAVPALTARLKDAEFEVRQVAADALNKIDPALNAEPSKEPNFVIHLKDGDAIQVVSMKEAGDFYFVTTVDGKKTGVAKDEIQKVEKLQR
ncbi:MAG: HEAT repeat domain-containing protein [Planctomycetota bacterium]|nr:HEAT repeat domain-containing protein [Planctomycetota bacterium]